MDEFFMNLIFFIFMKFLRIHVSAYSKCLLYTYSVSSGPYIRQKSI
ncbi:hypothetical protein SAMN06265219_109153 [Gracilimonas mengyeensis]|uniref:Uncharacterized protein n=1 Tax=Gracilimonas mengyeensis TaxID=1302730 RepID=A0A521DVB8_9BACT|nr:hypothetical protein SAMN06265219_109153 [Gracilimonas mengyeensis]